MNIEEKRREWKVRRKMRKELKEYDTIQFWNNRLSASSEIFRMMYFVRFMQYLNSGNSKFKEYTPDQLIEYQRDAASHARYHLLNQVQGYIGTLEKITHPDGKHKYRSSTIGYIYSTLRSFFAHNRCGLPRDIGFTMVGEVPPVEGDLTTDEIREVIHHVNPVYKAAFLSIFQGGMDQQSFTYWNENGYKDLVKQLEKDPKAIRIRFPRRPKVRRKIEQPFHTYVGTDGIDYIRKWLDIRPDINRARDDDGIFVDKETTVIFTNQIKHPVTKQMLDVHWRDALFKLGIIKKKRAGYSGNRYGKNLHEMRDVFRSVWEKTSANKNVAEFMMGHQVDPLHYNKACRDMEWTESEYLKALPWLNIMSGGGEMKAVKDELTEKNAQIEELKAEISRLKVTPIDKEALIEDILVRLAGEAEKKDSDGI